VTPADPAVPAPVLRVVRGDPTPEDLAALVVVLAARPAAPAPEPAAATGWADRAALLRHPPHPGPHAWRTSALPQ
jgi:hypothetical protein